ncbi:MAG: hypothetical protein WDA59_08915 [Methanofastidiosum sp.]
MKDKEFLFREMCNIIKPLECYFNYHQLHEFFTKEDCEFRLGGKYGFGFKIYFDGNQYYFSQYPEDETEESKKWIELYNQYLKQLAE